MQAVINRALVVTMHAEKRTIVSALLTIFTVLTLLFIVLPIDVIIAKGQCRSALNKDVAAVSATATYGRAQVSCSRPKPKNSQ